MAEIYIPFTKGQSEAVDAKLLPQGLFVSAQNVRYAKDARLGARSAYRASALSGAPTSTDVIGAASHDLRHSITISRRTSQTSPAKVTRLAYGAFASATPTTPALTPIAGACLGVFEKATSRTFASLNSVSSCDSVASGGYIYTAATGYVLSTKVATDTSVNDAFVVYKIDAASGAIVGQASGLLFDVASQNVHLVVVGGVLCVFWVFGSQVRMTSLNLTTMAVVTPATTVVTQLVGKSSYFDVSPGGSASEAYLVYMSAASTLRFGTVSSVGIFAQLSTIAGSSTELRPAISATGLAPTDQVVIAWNDGATFVTGSAKYTVYRRSTTSFLIGTTTVDSSGNVQGHPVVSPNAVSDWTAAFNVAQTSSEQYLVGTFVSGGSAKYVVNQRLASKPFVAGNLSAIVTTDADTAPGVQGAYYAYDLAGGSLFSLPEALFAQGIAKPADVATALCDPRRNVVAVAANAVTPGLSALAVVLPVQSDQETGGWALFRCEYGARVDSLSCAKLNGQTHVAGSVCSVYDGQGLVTTCFPTPLIYGVTSDTSVGSIAAGTYQVILVWEWFDSGGRRHRSAPSLPTTVTVTSSGRILVSAAAPHATNLALGGSTTDCDVRVRAYRTLANGTVFYDAVGYGQTATPPAPGGIFQLSLTAADAAISANEILYTQGAQGGLSGLLENDRPPAAKYIWAGSDRLILGGLENPSEVRWSKLRVQGEPMQFTDFGAYKAQIDGAVTAVAEMDGTWFVSSFNSWWQVVGQGPDDNGGGGSFDAPRRLPSDIGCISAKSLLMTGQGLIFQGRSDGMFLLPRGGGGPQPIGWQVRDTLAAFPVVAASAFDQDSNVAYWAVVDSTASSGRLLVFDTRLGEWYVDNFLSRAIKTLSIYNGLLVIDGSIVETPGNYQDSDGSTTASVVPSLTTGDVRPFGLTGRGRLRKIQLEGEARDVTTLFTPTLDVSYDSGVSFTEPVSWPIASLAAGVGGAIEGADHTLKYPKGDKWRFRLSWSTPTATEGIVWSGLSLEIFQERGLQRVANSRRA